MAVASQAVVNAASSCFAACSGNNPVEFLTTIVEDAHRRIHATGVELGVSPRSTCVLLLLIEGKATWAHVGDSRLYRFEDGCLVERTLDHSVVELMRLEGRITEDEMAAHRDQNRLYEALGGPNPPNADIGSRIIGPRDGFLLASDGIWEHVADAQLEAALLAPDLGAALRELTLTVKGQAGQTCDNLSVAACRLPAAAEQRTVGMGRSRGVNTPTPIEAKLGQEG